MKHKQTIIALLLGVLLAGVLVPARVFAQTTIDFVSTVTPSDGEINPGDTFEVNISVDSGTQALTSIETYLDYDPNALQINGFVKGAQPSFPTEIPAATFSNANGTFDYNGLSFSAPSGQFDFVTITFQALSAGTTSITFSDTAARGSKITGGGLNLTGAADPIVIDVVEPQQADTEAPVITLLGDAVINLTVGDTYNEQNATASDNVDGDISGDIVIDASAVDTGAAGSYTVTYNVSDAAGNAAAQVTRTVNVSEVVALPTQVCINAGGPQLTQNGRTFLSANVANNAGGQSLTTDDYSYTGTTLFTKNNANIDVSNVQPYTDTLFKSERYGGAPGPNQTPMTWAIPVANGDYTVELFFAEIFIGQPGGGSNKGNGDRVFSVSLEGEEVITDLDPFAEFGNSAFILPFDVTITDQAVNLSFLADTDNAKIGAICVLPDEGDPVDTEAPVITLLGANPLELTVGDSYEEPGAEASDDVDGDISGDIVIDASTVNTSAVGSYTVTYNVSDAAGNAATEVTRTVNVNAAPDNTPPTITLLGDNPLELTVGASYNEPGAEATDDVDGDISGDIVIDDSAVNTSAVGSYTVTYNVSDAAGNAAAQVTRTVNVSAPPSGVQMVINPAQTTVEQGDTFSVSVEVITDQPLSAAEAYIEFENTFLEVQSVTPGDTLDSNLVAATFDNNAGTVGYGAGVLGAENAVSEDFTLLTIEFAALQQTEATSLDFFDPEGAASTNVVFSGLNILSGTTGATVTITEDAPPTIALLGDNPQTMEAGDEYAEAGATASDNEDGNLTESIVITGDDFDTTVPDDYTVTYTVTDSANNTVSETRTVTVEDTTAPIIALNGDNPQEITVGDAYNELGATASDIVDGDFAVTDIDASAVNTAVAGTYTVTYNAVDAAGNAAAQVTRTVNVSAEPDTTPPVIVVSATNGELSLNVGDAYVEADYYTATDNVDGVITESVEVGGDTVDTSVPGTYTVTYNVSDAAGNAATEQTLTVTVSDVTAPTILVDGDAITELTIELEQGATYTAPVVTATDDVDETVTVVESGDTVDPNSPGTYVITYNAQDNAGNAAVPFVLTVQVTASANADIVAVAPDTPVIEGSTFLVDINIVTNQPIEVAEIHLNFDTNFLQVIDLTAGDDLELTLITPTFDNALGTIDYAAGSVEELPDETFTLLTIEFQAIEATEGTSLVFTDRGTGTTNVAFAETLVTDEIIGTTVTIDDSATLVSNVALQGRPSAPDESWSMPIVVKLYEENSDTLVAEYNVTTDENGNFTVTGIEPGTYQVAVKSATTLQVVQTMTLSSGENVKDNFGTLFEGDTNNDNVVNLIDFTVLAGAYNTSSGEVTFDVRADFNQDGSVDLQDFTLLAANYNKPGDNPSTPE